MKRYIHFAFLFCFLALANCSSLENLSSLHRSPDAVQVGVTCNDVISSFFNTEYKDFRKRLDFVESSLSSEEKDKLAQVVDSLNFVDFTHSSLELNQIATGAKKLSDSNLEFKYNKGPKLHLQEIYEEGEEGFLGKVKKAFSKKKYLEQWKYDEDAFGNFQKAREYLLTEKPDFSLDTFKRVHELMMDGGIENISSQELGTFRIEQIIGNETGTRGLLAEEVAEIERNPYTFFESRKVLNSNNRYNGKIWYPNAKYAQEKTLSTIVDVNPALYKSIKEFQETGVGNEGELTSQLVNTLTEEVFKWFVREKDQIGPINNSKAFDQYINLIAQFQRDLVSIHPFKNGNGRTTREFSLSYALMMEGFPPPRLFAPGDDLYKPIAEWQQQVKDGVVASAELYDDLLMRAKLGLKLENSPELLSPKVVRETFLKYIKQGKTKVSDDLDNPVFLDSREFLKFYEYYMKSNPELVSELNTNAEDIFTKVYGEYYDFIKRSKVFYLHKKNGKENVFLTFVDRDYVELFGRNFSFDKKAWDYKMENWHTKDIVWRGLSSRTNEASDAEIYKMFSDVHVQFTSNNVMKQVHSNMSPEDLKKVIVKDFDDYNEDLYSGGLAEMAKDHSETGPKYGISYGYSTSKNRTVGKAFAMGAMAIAEYGQHNTPEHQAKLSSRVLVGLRRGNKDVDLGRLRHTRDEFRYRYGRQQEVMGIGAADPDSLMIVQTIDAEGEVIFSYLRNEQKPWEIYKVKGDLRKVDNNIQDDQIVEIKSLK